MQKIRLLDFFHTGKLGAVEIGMTQSSVFSEFGEPDRWTNDDRSVNSMPFIPSKATLWGYGAIELLWTKPESGLHMISFALDSLHLSSKNELDRWVFRNDRGTTWTYTYLKEALDKESILYKDTGLEIISWEGQTYQSYKVTAFTRDRVVKYDSDDVFGTLVLKSGVQIRYGADDYIIRISMPGRWLIMGSEQTVV